MFFYSTSSDLLWLEKPGNPEEPFQSVLEAWPGSFWVSVVSRNPPGKRVWVLWVLHCCLGLEAGLEPSLDQDGFSSSGESVCGGLAQGLGKEEAEASPHSSCCCC